MKRKFLEILMWNLICILLNLVTGQCKLAIRARMLLATLFFTNRFLLNYPGLDSQMKSWWFFWQCRLRLNALCVLLKFSCASNEESLDSFCIWRVAGLDLCTKRLEKVLMIYGFLFYLIWGKFLIGCRIKVTIFVIVGANVPLWYCIGHLVTRPP